MQMNNQVKKTSQSNPISSPYFSLAGKYHWKASFVLEWREGWARTQRGKAGHEVLSLSHVSYICVINFSYIRQKRTILSKKNVSLLSINPRIKYLHTDGIFMFPFLFILTKSVYFLKKTKASRVGEKCKPTKGWSMKATCFKMWKAEWRIKREDFFSFLVKWHYVVIFSSDADGKYFNSS